MTSQDDGELFFEVDARHIAQLGRELVADRITALAELIKNAYDADATQVVISFENAAKTGGSIEVADDGLGMSLDDVKFGWMRLSTLFKVKHPLSPRYRRVRAGQKGIGRFAVETLGKHLVLRSVAKDSAQQIEVTFDWESAYKPGMELGAVPNPYRLKAVSPDSNGTTLLISRLHSPWESRDVTRALRAVLLLQPPFPVRSPAISRDGADPGFAVSVLVEGGATVEVSGLDDFYESATARVEGVVGHDGSAIWSVKGINIDLDSYRSDLKPLVETGPLSFQALYYIYRKNAIGSIAVQLAQEMGRRYGGIRVYRDGMRTMPYGEQGNDWLGLDEQTRRRQVLPPIGNNNWFGQVEIGRETNPTLIDTASREGLVENESFQEMQHFVASGLIWAATEVAAARQRKARTSGKTTRRPASRDDLLREARKRIEEATEGMVGPQAVALRKTVLDTLSAFVDEATLEDKAAAEREAELLDEIQLLRILASLGTAIAVFSHEVRSIVNLVRAEIGDLEEALRETGESSVELVAKVEQLQFTLTQLADLAQYIDLYVGHARIRTKSPQPILVVVQEFNSAFRSTMANKGIELTEDVDPKRLRTMPMTRSELQAVLFNLLTNAIKAMDREGNSLRKIRVTAREVYDKVVIRFEDTGQGIDPDIKDRIFEPFITTSHPDDSELGSGTGLGLKIVRDIVEANKGTVRVTAPVDGYSTCFEVSLPVWIAP